jgi:heme exporter protein A
MIVAGNSLDLAEVGLNRGGRALISGLSLSLRPGQLALLMGPNGSGKTSLLRAIGGFAPIAHGTIVANGITVTGNESDVRQSIAYLGHLDGLKKDLTAEENIQFINSLRGSSRVVSELIAELGLAPVAHRSVRLLSAGQKRRVALAALRTSQAPLWLLDEPLTNLDRMGRELLVRWLDSHLQLGGTAVVATHRSEELLRPGCLLVEL